MIRTAILALLVAFALPLFAETPAPPAALTAPSADAVVEPSGLASLILTPGTGEDHPGATDYARVRYTVWSSTGELIQHLETPKSVTVAVASMLPGWRMATEQMVTGESRRIWVPASFGAGKIAEGELYVIDAELIEIVRPQVAPPDVAAPPASATTSESGLAWIVLQSGTGGDHPTPRSHVTVHYTGWTTDGTMIDSSVLRGQPATFPLTGVIRGWTEGVQLMTRGEKRRFWVPAALAYGRDKSKPQGMLVFDIELIDF
jgi:FKBP-type peptidyl-prolyl cis-trans isomerase